MLRVARMNVFPPGGWAYVQPETGMKFPGNALFKEQARQVATHRSANGLPRATQGESEDDLMATVCTRYPGICIDSKTRQSVSLGVSGGPKSRMGCSSCGGRKR